MLDWLRNLRDGHKALSIVQELRWEMSEWTEKMVTREERMRKRNAARAKELIAEEAGPPAESNGADSGAGDPKSTLRAVARSRGYLK